MTYYIGNEVNLDNILGVGNPRYFYALRRTDAGELYFSKIDQLQDTDAITVNIPGPNAENFEDFEYGVDYFDGRLQEDHSRPFENLYFDQYRWDGKNCFYYIKETTGELVVRINQVYEYPSEFIASISGTTMTVSEKTYGTIKVGMSLTGTGIQVPTTIVAQLTGTTGDAGTYTVSVDYDGTPPTVASTSILGTL